VIADPEFVLENLRGTIDNTVQLQVHGVDLTVGKILYADPGLQESYFIVDFDNSKRSLPTTIEVKQGFVLEAGKPMCWLLTRNTNFVIVYNEYVSIPEGYAGFILPRSTLLRGGATLHSALWDAGYSGRGTGLLSVGPVDLIVTPNARLGQLIFIKAGTSRKYEGVYNRERSKIWTDGSVSGPARAKRVTCSYMVEGGDGIKVFGLPPETTIPVAEYWGMIKALTEIKSFEIEIISDSRLVVCQLNTRLGKNKPEDKMAIHDPKLQHYNDLVLDLCKDRKVTFTWMPRGNNKADTGAGK
jgi:deoxycytidine triphosphate deaminase